MKKTEQGIQSTNSLDQLHPSSLIPHPSTWRVFCAVPLSEEVRRRAAAHISKLREMLPDARASWDKPEKLHITLKFVGDIETSSVEALSQATERAAKEVETFTLSIDGAGFFPPRGLPRVLWLGVQDRTGKLSTLHGLLEDEAARAGFAREERAFHPHLTIARLRKPEGAKRLAQLHEEMGFEAAEFTVSELLVIRSELGPGGSRYTVISRHRLRARWGGE